MTRSSAGKPANTYQPTSGASAADVDSNALSAARD